MHRRSIGLITSGSIIGGIRCPTTTFSTTILHSTFTGQTGLLADCVVGKDNGSMTASRLVAAVPSAPLPNEEQGDRPPAKCRTAADQLPEKTLASCRSQSPASKNRPLKKALFIRILNQQGKATFHFRWKLHNLQRESCTDPFHREAQC